ncbi:MAG: DNA primase [Armatimonadetes bacterium]|nr:DNA primase [Armatimonadota bacterium]
MAANTTGSTWLPGPLMAADQKEEIRQRNDIVEVISDYVALKRAGSEFQGLCPFHKEKTPSFTVSREKQVFHCFGCNVGGDVFDFIMRHDALDFVQAARKLAERVNLRFEVSGDHAARRSERERILEINAMVSRWYHEALGQAPEAAGARAYLARRGIDDATAERFQLGYSLDSWDALLNRLRRARVTPEEGVKAGLVSRRREGTGHFDWFRGRLMFPIWDVSGNVVGFGGRALKDESAKYVNTAETPVFSKGDLLYALNLAARDISAQGEVILVEGYMDTIALHQHGITNAVATMGTAVTPRSGSTLARYAKTIVAAFDGDSAGMAAVVRGATIFQEQEIKVRIVEMPAGKDPDDWVREAGPEAFQQAVRDAVSLIDYRLNRAVREQPAGSAKITAEMVRQVVPILCDLRSEIEREEQIGRLAVRWCHPDLGRVQQAEAAIRHEVRQALRRPTRPQGRSPQASGQQAPPLRPQGPRPVPGYVRAEHELLSAMLHETKAARYVKEHLALDEWADDTCRAAAAALFAHLGGLVQTDVGKVVADAENTEAKALLSRLALEPPAMATTETRLAERIELIRDRARRKRWEEVRAEVNTRLAAGTLSGEDPLHQEYQELARHFRQGVKYSE